MKNDVLKTLAQKAKDRMKTKYNLDENKKIDTKRNLRGNEECKIQVISDGIDDKFYSKFIGVLKEEPLSLIPIKMLINEAVYNSLDKTGKERYFFDILEKYNKCKVKYEEECMQRVK